ncbi:MAG: hypothetical protein LBV45_10895 [Xanthomonadaceae bacterium]|nr:hypothetical protein [Xanthomonadaceae bacterium]
MLLITLVAAVPFTACTHVDQTTTQAGTTSIDLMLSSGPVHISLTDLEQIRQALMQTLQQSASEDHSALLSELDRSTCGIFQGQAYIGSWKLHSDRSGHTLLLEHQRIHAGIRVIVNTRVWRRAGIWQVSDISTTVVHRRR